MNMFIDTLEKVFDEFFKKKHENRDMGNAKVMMEYREELENFAQFLIEEYEQSITDVDYWGHRFLRNEE